MRDAVWCPITASRRVGAVQRFLSTPQMYSIAMILLQPCLSAAAQEQEWSCSYTPVSDILCTKRVQTAGEPSNNPEPSQRAEPGSISFPDQAYQRNTHETANQPQIIQPADFSGCTDKCRNIFKDQFSETVGNAVEHGLSLGTSSKQSNIFLRQSSLRGLKGRAGALPPPAPFLKSRGRSSTQTQYLTSAARQGLLNYSQGRLAQALQSGYATSVPSPCIQQLANLLLSHSFWLLSRGNNKEAVTELQRNRQNPKAAENQPGNARPRLRALEDQYREQSRPTPLSTEQHQNGGVKILVSGLLDNFQAQGTAPEIGAQNRTPSSADQLKISSADQDQSHDESGARQETDVQRNLATTLQSNNHIRADNSPETWSDISSQATGRRIQHQPRQNTSVALQESGHYSGTKPVTIQGIQKVAAGRPPRVQKKSPFAAQGSLIPSQPHGAPPQKTPFRKAIPRGPARNQSSQIVQRERAPAQRQVDVKQTYSQGAESIPRSNPVQRITGFKSLPLLAENKRQWPPLNSQATFLKNKPPQQMFQPHSFPAVKAAAQQNFLPAKINAALNESRPNNIARNSTLLARMRIWKPPLFKPNMIFHNNRKVPQGNEFKPAPDLRPANEEKPAGRGKVNLVPNRPRGQYNKQNTPPHTKAGNQVAPRNNYGASIAKNELAVQATRAKSTSDMKSLHAVHPAKGNLGPRQLRKGNLGPRQLQQTTAPSNGAPMAKATEQRMLLISRDGDNVKNLVPQPAIQEMRAPELKAPRVIQPIQAKDNSVSMQLPRLQQASAALKTVTLSIVSTVGRQRNIVTNAPLVEGVKQKHPANHKATNLLQPPFDRKYLLFSEELQQPIHEQNAAALPKISPPRTPEMKRQSSSLTNQSPLNSLPHVSRNEFRQPPFQRKANFFTRQPQQKIQPNSKRWMQPRKEPQQVLRQQGTFASNQSTRQDYLRNSNYLGQQLIALQSLLYPLMNISHQPFAQQGNPPGTLIK